jgi:transposase
MQDRHDLTDEEWARLEPLLPDRRLRRGGRWADHRAVIDGVLWRTRTGSPWRDLPVEYGHWKTVYNRHRRWSADGTWVRILDELRRGCDQHVEADQRREWAVGVDSTVVRAHQHAAGARRRPAGEFAAEVSGPAGADTGGWVELHRSGR